jgi:hypothetical protein
MEVEAVLWVGAHQSQGVVAEVVQMLHLMPLPLLLLPPLLLALLTHMSWLCRWIPPDQTQRTAGACLLRPPTHLAA